MVSLSLSLYHLKPNSQLDFQSQPLQLLVHCLLCRKVAQSPALAPVVSCLFPQPVFTGRWKTYRAVALCAMLCCSAGHTSY